MKIKDVGEFGLINLLNNIVVNNRVTNPKDRLDGIQLLVDTGDDAAAWKAGHITHLYSTDTLVEDVHFKLKTISWYDLGHKALAVNMSDIAAMGGRPLHAFVSLGLPGDTDISNVVQLYEGMLRLANQHNVPIIGGDVVGSTKVFITLGITGTCHYSPMLRSTAQVGDLIGITGNLGSSAGGLKIILESISTDSTAANYLVSSHVNPEPCIEIGQTLIEHGVKSAMDISDGLVGDLSKLCSSSGVCAKIHTSEIPVSHQLKTVFQDDYLDMALYGGEDYQLIFTAPADIAYKVLKKLPPSAAIFGNIIEGEHGQVYVTDSRTGDNITNVKTGWDHFK